MLTLEDGPAKGTYMCKRAPMFLRAIISTVTNECDVLDLVTDTPGEREAIYVYRRQGEAGAIHLNMGSGKGGKAGMKHGTGFYALASYRFMEDVDDSGLRDNAAWQRWAIQMAEHDK